MDHTDCEADLAEQEKRRLKSESDAIAKNGRNSAPAAAAAVAAADVSVSSGTRPSEVRRVPPLASLAMPAPSCFSHFEDYGLAGGIVPAKVEDDNEPRSAWVIPASWIKSISAASAAADIRAESKSNQAVSRDIARLDACVASTALVDKWWISDRVGGNGEVWLVELTDRVTGLADSFRAFFACRPSEYSFERWHRLLGESSAIFTTLEKAFAQAAQSCHLAVNLTMIREWKHYDAFLNSIIQSALSEDLLLYLALQNGPLYSASAFSA
jgi:hypothetical protein